jgi:uncharacterized protein YhaN
LWREAARVAAQAGAGSALHRARQQLAVIEGQTRQAAARAQAAQTRWMNLWEPLGIVPLSPREMRGWLQARHVLVLQAGEAQDRRAEVERIQHRIATHRAALDQALRSLGEAEPPAPPVETLNTLRDRAEQVIARRIKIAAQHDELIQSAVRLQRQLETAQAQEQVTQERLKAWRAAWARAVAPLDLPPEASPDQAEAVLDQAANLHGQIKDAHEARSRLAAIQREVEHFARDVRDLCRRVAPELMPCPVQGSSIDDDAGVSTIALAAQELVHRLRAAQQAKALRADLYNRREQELANAGSARRQREDAEARLIVLCQEAGCTAPEDLPAAERASRAARQLQNRIQELDQQLGTLCGHEPIEAFRQAAFALDVDRLPEQSHALAEEIARLDAERGKLNQELGRERNELARMDGAARAADAAERVEHLKTRLAQEVEDYARLRLAAAVLDEAIERYRQKTQGPVLARAGARFATLTLGSFQGLRVEYDDHDQAMLRAVRPGGTESVGVAGLSLGTADQLYLALRLASIETALDAQEPIPLIADDILIQFDNDRAAAGLRVLAELSNRTQIVLFTHHEHVCELAEANVDSQSLFLHRLPGPRRAGRTTSMTS